MEHFGGKIAVVTGGGTGMGRELARQLTAEGCSVAMCDVSAESMAETKALCEQGAPSGTIVTTFVADVSDEAQMRAFRDAVVAEHGTDHIDLLFNNAGVGGGGSVVKGDRREWDRTFAICWGGVYNGTWTFMPMLIASQESHIVNTSSVNGLWASIGPTMAHTAYSAAKFAVRGFTEALITDLRVNAPHVHPHVVMPGHIGTSIVINSGKILGNDPETMDDTQLGELRATLIERGMPVEGIADEDLRKGMQMIGEGFRDLAPMTAAEAATVILDGVRADRWRILVGADAEALDVEVRADPEGAYEPEFWEALRAKGVFGAMGI